MDWYWCVAIGAGYLAVTLTAIAVRTRKWVAERGGTEVTIDDMLCCPDSAVCWWWPVIAVAAVILAPIVGVCWVLGRGFVLLVNLKPLPSERRETWLRLGKRL